MNMSFENHKVIVRTLSTYGFVTNFQQDSIDFFYLTIINNHVNSLDYSVYNGLPSYFAHVESYILNQDWLHNKRK